MAPGRVGRLSVKSFNHLGPRWMVPLYPNAHGNPIPFLKCRLRKAADLESGAIFRRVAAGASSFVGGPDACSSSAGRLLRGHR